MFENMALAIGHNHIKPVVDRTFDFTEVPEALRLMQQASHFGKIAIEFPHL
jgi:NADPH:quinone reductase-like Zn-dependent oxidoreductase